MIVEVCVDSLESIHAAICGGANRIELCSSLSEGGLTPTPGMTEQALKLAAQASIPVFAMLRPRRGDFDYGEDEVDWMYRDLAWLRHSGVQGIVTGMLTAAGTIDRARIAPLVQAANPLPVTFHRAFDVCTDPFRSLDELIDLGITRLLTSGQQSDANAGRELIRRLVERSDGRVIIMPGGGVTAANVRAILAETSAREIHFSGSIWQACRTPAPHLHIPLEAETGHPPFWRKITDAETVRKIVSLAHESAD